MHELNNHLAYVYLYLEGTHALPKSDTLTIEQHFSAAKAIVPTIQLNDTDLLLELRIVLETTEKLGLEIAPAKAQTAL